MGIRDKIKRLERAAEGEIATLVCQECGEELRVRDGIELDLIAEAWTVGYQERGGKVYGETPEDVRRIFKHRYGWAALRLKDPAEGLPGLVRALEFDSDGA